MSKLENIQFGGKIENSEKGRSNPVDLLLDQLASVPELAAVVASEMDLSFLTPEQKAESLWATFQSLKGNVSGRKKSGKQLDRLKLQLAVLKELKDDPEAWAAFETAYGKHITEIEGINGDYEKYQALDRQVKSAQDVYNATARNMFERRGEGIDEVEVLLFETNKRHMEESRAQMEELVAKNPELGGLIQYQKIKEYGRELREQNFAMTGSRRGYLEEMEMAALAGRPLLIFGESGTGKSRLIEMLALILTGDVPLRIPSKHTRLEELVAKRDFFMAKHPDGSEEQRTFYRYQAIGEAATGKKSTLPEEPVSDGLLVRDDEFLNLEPEEQKDRIKAIADWKPGKTVVMPVTNERTVIRPKYMYVAAGNMKSERYLTSHKTPPEVLREFGKKIDIDYLPQENNNPELYEIILAALMDENGRVRAAESELAPEYEYEEQAATAVKDGLPTKQTLQVRKLLAQKEVGEGTAKRTVPAGGFLWRLANAIHELNKSFAREQTVLRSKGDAQFVKEILIDTGQIVECLRGYLQTGRAESLEDFVIEWLNTQFLQNKSYSADDRALAKDFLTAYGINSSKPKYEKEELPEFKNLTPLEVGLLSPRVEYKKVVSEEPTLDVMTIIDKGKRVEVFLRPFKQGKEEFIPGKIAKFPDGRMRIYRGLTKGGDPVWEVYIYVSAAKKRHEALSLPTPETLSDTYKPFLAETFHGWYSGSKTQAELDLASGHLPEIIEPTHLDWAAKKDEPADASKFGEYTLNPNTVGLDWETIPENKIKIITLPEALSGKPLAEVAKYIIDTYSSDYHLPGIEYWQYILNNPDKAPAELKDKKNYHFFFGSLLRDANGDWRVPYARWVGTVWNRGASWLTSVWFSDCRVVLVEK